MSRRRRSRLAVAMTSWGSRKIRRCRRASPRSDVFGSRTVSKTYMAPKLIEVLQGMSCHPFPLSGCR
ncbi:hypothetical protein SynMITS9220_00599 [Synechococcus sp. MIT S9220]|nr:hypothetical protein SynMITS9220_00599 [Synechococcus sp. MIT S9220]